VGEKARIGKKLVKNINILPKRLVAQLGHQALFSWADLSINSA
jgi:hypothetical protein